MNTNLYVENGNGAMKLARKEVFDAVQEYMIFYRESKGFKKYFKREVDEIRSMARDKWQSIMNNVNAYALYFGLPQYKEYLVYVNKLKELMHNSDEGHYGIVAEWREKYPELAKAQDKVEEVSKEGTDDIVFIDFYNELRIAVNKEFLSKLA